MARPKRQFSDEEEAKITDMALNNCHFETIAMCLDIAVNTLKRRYGRYIRQKRAEGRVILRQRQVNLSRIHPAMAIFLGKNELGQVDKQVIETEATEKAKLNEAEVVEARKIANILNLEDARKGKVG